MRRGLRAAPSAQRGGQPFWSRPESCSRRSRSGASAATAIGVAVGREQHALGRHRRPVRGRHFPAPAIAGERRDARPAADQRARLLGRTREAARITERLHRARHAGRSSRRGRSGCRRACARCRGRAVRHGRAAPLPLLGPARGEARHRRRRSRAGSSRSACLAIDPVARDQIEYGVRRAAGDVRQVLARLRRRTSRPARRDRT